MRRFFAFLQVFLLAACASAVPGDVIPTVTPILAAPGVVTRAPVFTPVPAVTRRPTITPLPETPTPRSLEQYQPYSIQALRSRTYGGGDVVEMGQAQPLFGFTRHFIAYSGDGLKLTGYLNVPKGPGPFPLVIVVHGYTLPGQYETLGYLTDLCDALAQAGFAVLYPDLRGYPPAQDGDTFFRVGYAIDVLNLIALVKEKGGQPGLFERLAPGNIGLVGHSMGGGVVLRVMAVTSDVKAAVLYASISGDETRDSQLFYELSGSEQNLAELSAPAFALSQISPIYFLGNVRGAVRLFHGTADPVVPLAWAQDTCAALRASVRDVDCVFYEGGEHTFRSRYGFGPALLAFFDEYLRPNGP